MGTGGRGISQGKCEMQRVMLGILGPEETWWEGAASCYMGLGTPGHWQMETTALPPIRHLCVGV